MLGHPVDAPVHVYVAPHQLPLEAARAIPGVDQVEAGEAAVVLTTRRPSEVLPQPPI